MNITHFIVNRERLLTHNYFHEFTGTLEKNRSITDVIGNTSKCVM